MKKILSTTKTAPINNCANVKISYQFTNFARKKSTKTHIIMKTSFFSFVALSIFHYKQFYFPLLISKYTKQFFFKRLNKIRTVIHTFINNDNNKHLNEKKNEENVTRKKSRIKSLFICF